LLLLMHLCLLLLCCLMHCQVASSRLSSSCRTCGGGLQLSISASSARKRLTVFQNLAAFHKFHLLQQLAEVALLDGLQQQITAGGT
jgi:hypothetical protein